MTMSARNPALAAGGRPASRRQTLRDFMRIEARLLPAIVLTYACILPSELTFEIADIAFSPHRLAGVLMLPFVFGEVKKNPIRLSRIDLMIGFCAIWYVVSSYAVDGFPIVVTRGVATMIDLSTAYLIGRSSIRSHEDVQRFLILVLPGVALTGLTVFLESVLQRPLVRPVIAGLLGKSAGAIDMRVRLGLMRGSGPFYHPILAGTFLTSFLALYWYSFRSMRRLRIGGILAGLSGFFTMSSAALIAIVMTFAGIGGMWIQRNSRIPVFVLAALGAVAAYIALLFASNSGPLSIFIRYLTISSDTAFYRRKIWEFGVIEVQNHPIFGIGQREYERPAWMVKDSVDAYWLLLSMQHGLPLGLGLFGAFVAVMVMLGRAMKKLPRGSTARDMHFGMIVSLFVFGLSAFTVHLFDGLDKWLMLQMAAGVSVVQHTNRLVRPAPRAPRGPVRMGAASSGLSQPGGTTRPAPLARTRPDNL